MWWCYYIYSPIIRICLKLQMVIIIKKIKRKNVICDCSFFGWQAWSLWTDTERNTMYKSAQWKDENWTMPPTKLKTVTENMNPRVWLVNEFNSSSHNVPVTRNIPTSQCCDWVTHIRMFWVTRTLFSWLLHGLRLVGLSLNQTMLLCRRASYGRTQRNPVTSASAGVEMV